jgi:hypothetical protein
MIRRRGEGKVLPIGERKFREKHWLKIKNPRAAPSFGGTSYSSIACAIAAYSSGALSMMPSASWHLVGT